MVDDLTIRRARPDDHAAFVRLFGELGVPDPVPGPERFAEAIMPQMWIGSVGDAAVGYVTWRAYGTTAHVIQIAVDQAMRGQRIGERLLEHVRGEARAAGCTRWYLNVKRDNTPALRLYDRVGFRFELESLLLKITWASVPAIAVDGGLATIDDDAQIAAQFNLPVERIAMFRARPAYRLVTLRDGAAIAGFAAFDPTFPGAATFCATRPELASALLVAMRAHAEPQHDFVRVTIEGNRPLADAVCALGGEVTFEILRLSADVT